MVEQEIPGICLYSRRSPPDQPGRYGVTCVCLDAKKVPRVVGMEKKVRLYYYILVCTSTTGIQVP